MQPDDQLYKDLMQNIEDYTGLPDNRDIRYEKFPYPQRLCVLSDMQKYHILRAKGDIKQFIRLEDELLALPGYQQGKFAGEVHALAKWLDSVMDSVKPTSGGVVISMLVWGHEHVTKMLDYTFKSLLSPGNLPALVKEMEVTIHFQTDAESKGWIEMAEITGRLKALGVKFEYALFPRTLVGSHDLLYWMVGAGASAALHYAKYSGAAFHHSYPDIIYSENFFTELLRLSQSHHSILAPAVRSDEGKLLPSLKDYTQDDTITVPADHLVSLGLNAMHMSFYPCMVNNRPRPWNYPHNHVMLWESDDSLYFNCPHLNALWLSQNVTASLEDRYYISLDSELDLICTGEDYCIPRETDNLYLIEFSEQARSRVIDTYADAASCGRHIWTNITWRDQFKFFVRGMRVRLNREIRPKPVNVFSNENIIAERTYLFNCILSVDPYVGAPLKNKRSHEGRMFLLVS